MDTLSPPTTTPRVEQCSENVLHERLWIEYLEGLPVPDRGDAAIGHGLGEGNASLIGNVAKAAANHRIAKTKHQRPAVVVDAVPERIVPHAQFDEAIVIGAQEIQFDLT